MIELEIQENIKMASIAIGKSAQFEKVVQATEKYVAGILSSGHCGILSPINISFEFDYAALNSAPTKEFLQLLLFEPIQCVYALREVAWLHVCANLSRNKDYIRICYEKRSVSLQQIHCSIRFAGLPLTDDEFIFRPFVHPIRLGVTAIHCVCTGLGDRGSYVEQSIWYCPAKCEENECRIVGRCPIDWTQNDERQTCSRCMINMKEHTDFRKVCQYLWIKIHLTEDVRTAGHLDGRIKRGVTAQLMDGSCDCELVLGEEYIVVGNYDPMANHFNVWNMTSARNE